MFARLLQRDFEGYFAELADTPTDLWFFLHIPKTAGSSFWNEFSQRLKPIRNVEIAFAEGSTPDESRRLALDELLQARAQHGVRAARAHLMRRDLDPMLRAIPRTRLVTMLRDPVERVISDFRYSRTPAHPPYRKVIAKYPTLESYVEDPVQQNVMLRYLQRSRSELASSTGERLLQEFAFVGFAESYPLSRRVLCRLLGKRPGPVAKLRATESLAENEVRLDAGMRRRIERLNELDQELFSSVFDSFRPLRAELRAWLERHEG